MTLGHHERLCSQSDLPILPLVCVPLSKSQFIGSGVLTWTELLNFNSKVSSLALLGPGTRKCVKSSISAAICRPFASKAKIVGFKKENKRSRCIMASRDEILCSLKPTCRSKRERGGKGKEGRREGREKEHECEGMTMNGNCLTLGPMETYLQLLLHFRVIWYVPAKYLTFFLSFWAPLCCSLSCNQIIFAYSNRPSPVLHWFFSCKCKTI